MGLTRWDPFRELSIMQERMNRMFDDAGRGWRGDEPSSTTTWMLGSSGSSGGPSCGRFRSQEVLGETCTSKPSGRRASST